MDAWFLRDMGRLARERREIATLQEAEDWLIDARWTLADGGLCVDAILGVHGHDYEVRMLYPELFPGAPPIVRPVDSSARWSGHQYGDGTLCLEWGPDTWHPGVSGADMLKSTFRLLEIENPLGGDQHQVAPSRHHLSVGQEARTRYGRCYVSKQLADYLASVPLHSYGRVDFVIRWQSNSVLLLPRMIEVPGLPIWSDTCAPEKIYSPNGSIVAGRGLLIKTDTVGAGTSIGTTRELEETLNAAGYSVSLDAEREACATPSKQTQFGVLIVDREDHPCLFAWLNDDKCTPVPLASVVSAADTAGRIPEDLYGLAAKSVGVVGLGSVGSKIALSLGRAGVSSFFLVDDDVFLPENVCRHDLDWRNVGEHKVDALAERLAYVCPGLKIEVSRLNLSGQESNNLLSATLARLARSDLVIDATADPRVFGLTAAVASQYGLPLVWGEVSAGGIGGMIARSRVGRDPDPHAMRAIYHQFCSERDASFLPATGGYAAQKDDGSVWTASDADVAVIAHHMARLSIDTVLAREPSAFPYSMYLIGLARSWLFSAPFDTIPLDTTVLPPREPNGPAEGEPPKSEIKFFCDLLERTRSENPPA